MTRSVETAIVGAGQAGLIVSGLLRQAGSLTTPPRASTPQGTCESAMNSA